MEGPRYLSDSETGQRTGRRSVVLLNDTRVDRHHGCSLVIQSLAQLAHAQGIDIVAMAPAHRDWRDDPDLIAQITGADGVLVNGEGTIHHDRPAGAVLLAAGGLCRDLGKPSFLCNTSWAANGPGSADLASAFSLISTRESQSQNLIREFYDAPLCAPDAALLFDWPASADRSGVVVTDGVGRAATAALMDYAARHDATMINIRSPRPGLTTRISDFRRMLSRDHPLDLSNLRRAMQAARHGFGTTLATPEAFTARLSSAEMLVTGRFHAVIMALATRTPFLALRSNTHKIEATLADAGLDPRRCIAPEALSADSVAAVTGWTETERANLEAFIASGRAALRQGFAQFRSLL